MNGPLVVIGDVVLDVDVVGSAARLAPDAPVPVVDEQYEQVRAGGAGLAARFAAGHADEVVLVAPFADDDDGDRAAELASAEVRVVRLAGLGTTPVKRRVRVDGSTVVRLHRGSGVVPSGDLPDELVGLLRSAGAVLVSDYGNGTTGWPPLRRLLTDLVGDLPVVWDPHPRGHAPVSGSWLVTPNRTEAARACGTEPAQRLSDCEQQAAGLVNRWDVRAVALTMGPDGALLSYGAGLPMVFPAPRVATGDVCGAGDAFAAAAAAGLGSGLVTSDAVARAVEVAARHVRDGAGSGTTTGQAAARSAEDVVADVHGRRGTVVATGGCFDLLHPGHLHALRSARSLGDCLVVCLNSDRSVQQLKGPGRPVVGEAGRAAVLSALDCVDAVAVFDEATPDEVLRRLRPDVWVKGGDYDSLPEADLLEEWGGTTVVVPYLPGWSTTALTRAAADAGEPLAGRPA